MAHESTITVMLWADFVLLLDICSVDVIFHKLCTVFAMAIKSEFMHTAICLPEGQLAATRYIVCV